jgi:type II secretory pathway component GspD/PulD (secretin)
LKDREGIEQILTHRHRISHGTADETNAAVTAFLRERGSSTGSTATNTLVVSDIARVQDAIAGLLGQFDIETRQVSVVVIEVTGAANQAGTDSVKVTIIR